MKGYQRLTIRHEDGSHSFMYDYNAITPPIKILLDRLAELEDKIENGTLVSVPYSIGQELYCVYNKSYKIERVRSKFIIKYREIKRMNKNKSVKQTKWRYWLIEDGSVDVDELQQFIDENNLKIKIIIYRQGSIKPELKDF